MLPTTTNLAELILPNAAPVKFFKIDMLFQDEYDAMPENIREAYEFNEETRTYTLPNYEWLEWRKHGPYYEDPNHPQYITTAIGGSDIAALFDGSELSKHLFMYEGQHGSPYKTAIELFYEKTGQELPLKETVKEDVFWTGHNEEPTIRNLFQKMYQKDHPEDIVNVYNDCHMYQCGRKDSSGNLLYPFVLCDLDGVIEINGIKGVLECKTCNFTSEDYNLWKQGIVPLKYYLQACWYMACMNYPYAYICCKMGLQPSDFVYIYIERNLEIEKMILEMGAEFVKCVETGTEPDITGQSVKRLYTFWRKKMGNYKPEAPAVELNPSLKTTVIKINGINKELEGLKQQVTDLEEMRMKLLVENIFPVMGDSNFCTVDLSPTEYAQLKLKKSSRRPPIDTEKLQTELPDIYALYTIKEEKFNSTLFRKEQKNLVEQFEQKDDTLTETKQNYCEVVIKEKKGA